MTGLEACRPLPGTGVPGLNSVPSCGWPAHVGAGRAGAARLSWPSLLLPQISHTIREIRQFQQASYRIDHQPKVSRVAVRELARTLTACRIAAVLPNGGAWRKLSRQNASVPSGGAGKEAAGIQEISHPLGVSLGTLSFPSLLITPCPQTSRICCQSPPMPHRMQGPLQILAAHGPPKLGCVPATSCVAGSCFSS